MRAAVLTVARDAVEPALDGLLPLAPAGVRTVDVGAGVALVMTEDGAPLPELRALRAAAGPGLLDARLDDLPDEPLARRALLWAPVVVDDRVRLRPDWAPAPAPAPGILDLTVVSGPGAFGTGEHPTTLMCLALLLDVDPGPGGFADLGCGSGVLAAAAARLGHVPVLAVDVQEASVAAAAATARANGVTVDARTADLVLDSPPAAAVAAANVPPVVHAAIAATAVAGLNTLVVSGFHDDEAPAVLKAYADAGFAERRTTVSGGWTAALLARA